MNWLSWQIDYLLYLQNFRDISGHILDNFFLTVTMFGQIIIPMLFMCGIYWCINKKSGMLIIWNYMFGFIINVFLKCCACIYRPWILDSRVKPIESAIPMATGYSFPSGHTTGATTTWGSTVFIFWRNKLIRYTCITIIFLVMLSRNYVGVHTPQDVIVGFLSSILIIFLSYKLIKWEEKGKNRDILIFSLVSLISLFVLLFVNLKSYPMDYLNGKLLYYPTSVKIEMFARLGWIIGIFGGWIIEKRFINFDSKSGSLLKKLFRFIIGGLILYFLLNIDFHSRIMLFLSHIIIGLFITSIYPFFIKKFNF